jgi:predicted NAD-dependent protein-ADP-ribosyltransferase YbiA (DUF1768 family)
MNMLLLTGKKTIVEAGRDKIWSGGLTITDKALMDTRQWRGLNALGDILMKVRDVIRKD